MANSRESKSAARLLSAKGAKTAASASSEACALLRGVNPRRGTLPSSNSSCKTIIKGRWKAKTAVQELVRIDPKRPAS